VLTEPGKLPDGFILVRDFLSPAEEAGLIPVLAALRFGEVRMHGVVAKRRVAQFGWHYAFESFRLTPAPPLPAQLEPIRRRAAEFAGVSADEFSETLVTEYPPGAGIGWHRDRPEFKDVVGVSLRSPCLFRLRRKKDIRWERASIELQPRSAYLLRGPARTDWQHSIPPIDDLRYSVTFRSLRDSAK